MSKDRSAVGEAPYFDPALLNSMRDYWQIQMRHNSELSEKVIAACLEIPDFEAIIRKMPKELMEENNRRSIERSRRAFEEGDWQPYFENTRKEGERYALSGISFGAWIDLLRKYKAIVEPYIAADLGSEPLRALAAQSAMHELLYIAIETIGDAYVAARQGVIEKQKDDLLEANAVLEQFAFAASHDLKSPLRAVASIADWIEEDLAKGEKPVLAEHLSLMRQRIGRMTALLDSLLEYSKTGSQAAECTEIDLGRLAGELVETLPQHPGIQVAVAPGLPVFKAAAVPLRQVLSNLLSNAVKHHGGPGNVKVSAQDKGSSIEIDVEDDGQGIDPRYHERIFEIFQTVKSKDEVEGSGVGLALVKRTLARHGGAISLRSAPGQGSLFRVSWPKAA